MSSEDVTNIEVSRTNHRRLTIMKDLVRNETGKARVSMNDVVSYLLTRSAVGGI
jgi:hypothetical protein